MVASKTVGSPREPRRSAASCEACRSSFSHSASLARSLSRAAPPSLSQSCFVHLMASTWCCIALMEPARFSAVADSSDTRASALAVSAATCSRLLNWLNSGSSMKRARAISTRESSIFPVAASQPPPTCCTPANAARRSLISCCICSRSSFSRSSRKANLSMSAFQPSVDILQLTLLLLAPLQDAQLGTFLTMTSNC